MNPLLQKLISHIDWNDKSLNRTLISAESACSALLRRNIPRKEFLLEAIPYNPYAVLVLIHRYTKSAQLDEADYLCCKECLTEHCFGILTEFNDSCRDAHADIPYKFWHDRFLLCTASALALNRDDLLKQTFSCLTRFFEERDQASVFSMDVYELLLYSGNLVDNFARYYLQLYNSFPVEWCEGSAYNQGSEIPVSDPLPEALITLLRTAVQNRHMRCADLLRRLFVGVTLSQIHFTYDEYMQYAREINDSNFYRGLMLAEHFIRLDYDNELEAHNVWWALVLKNQMEDSSSWKETFSWFRFYHLSRQIILDPAHAGIYIEESPAIPDSDFTVHKTSEIVKAAQEALFLSDRKLIFEYLKKIGCYNYYRFNPSEKQFPFHVFSLGYDIGKAIEHLITLGYSNFEMVDIYMNTCMRCTYPFHLFLRKVFFSGNELNLHGRFADIREYFRSYPMSAQVVSFESGYRLSFNNTFNGYRYYSFSPQWWNEHKHYCSEHLKNGQRVIGCITALDLRTFQPCMELTLNEKEASVSEKLSGKDLPYFIKLLEEVVVKKELTTDANHRIGQLFLSLPLSEEDQQRIDLLILKCCAALSGNYSQVRYMLNMANRLSGGHLNRYKYRYDKKRLFTFEPDAELIREISACWEELYQSKLTSDEAFFIYINTILRHIVPFSEFVAHYFKEAPDVVKLTDLLSKHTSYWFSGTIRDIKYSAALSAWLIQTEPYQLLSQDTFSYRTGDASDYKIGDTVFFQIGSFKKSTRTFFVRTLQHNQDLRMATPFVLFKRAMNQAAYRTELNSYMRRDLNIHLPALSVRNISELIPSMLTALERRSNNLSAITEYLEIIQKNNPWGADKETVPRSEQLLIPQQSDIPVRIIRLFEKLTTQYSKHECIPIYNNSLLKSFFTPEDLEHVYTKKELS